MKWIWRIDVFCDLNNNTMDIDIIKLAKECPEAIRLVIYTKNAGNGYENGSIHGSIQY